MRWFGLCVILFLVFGLAGCAVGDENPQLIASYPSTKQIGVYPYAPQGLVVYNADLVIEAVPEDLELKVKTFKELDSVSPEHAILASNTSALPISALAAATKRQPKVIGIHFMNPVPVMKGVEMIRGRHTSDETFQLSKAFVQSLGKEPCEAVDYAGFMVSRILDAMLNEAFYCVMDGNKPEEVDKAMKICTNFPMGPLELSDLAGLDIVLHGLETLHGEFGDRLRPAPLLASMVRAGDLGRKTGRGFYDYTEKA